MANSSSSKGATTSRTSFSEEKEGCLKATEQAHASRMAHPTSGSSPVSSSRLRASWQNRSTIWWPVMSSA